MKKLILLILILIPVLVAFDCKGVKGSDSTIFSNLVILGKNEQGTTPKGVKVGAFNSVPAAAKNAIDKGMTTTFDYAAAEYPGKPFQKYTDYFAGVFWTSKKCPVGPAFTVGPSVSVGGNPYDQSEFDLDPRVGWTEVCVAGAFKYVNGKPGIFVVFDPKNPAGTEIAAQYETEHAVLVELDQWRFAATQFHAGTGHPIFPGVPSPESQGQSFVKRDTDVRGLSSHAVVMVDPSGNFTANTPNAMTSKSAVDDESAAWKRGERALLRLVKQ